MRLGEDDSFVALAVVMPREEEESIANGIEDKAEAETSAAPDPSEA